MFRARRKIAEREHNERAWHAWHVAALTRATRMPKLDKMLHRVKTRERQTPEQMLAIAAMLTVAHGGTVSLKAD